MLNFRLLRLLLQNRFINLLIILTALMSILTLIDFILLLLLSRLVGPWLSISIITFASASGYILAHSTINKRYKSVIFSVETGIFNTDLFPSYISSLFSTIFLVAPGILNKIIGVIIISPLVSANLGNRLMRFSGIAEWREVYEIVKLESATEIDSSDSN